MMIVKLLKLLQIVYFILLLMKSNIVLILIHYYGYRKSQETRVYNDKLIFIIAISCILICEVMNLLYLNTIVRYIVLTIMMILSFINRKKIISIVSSIRREKQ